MESFLSYKILWGIDFWRILLAALIVFIGFAGRKAIIYVFKGIFARIARRTQFQWDEEFVELTATPISIILQVVLWYVAAAVLLLPQEPVNIRLFVSQGLEAAMGVTFIWFALRIIHVISNILYRYSARTDTKLDDQLIPLCRKTAKLLIAVTGGIMIVQNMGYSVTSMIASIGVGGLALALAAKDTIANVFGSVIVFTDQPFQVGDWVEFAGIEGTVEEVGFRTTHIRRFDNSFVSVPNATFSTHPIVNHSRRPTRRIYFYVRVSHKTTSNQMRELLKRIRETIQNHPEIDQEFFFVKFSDIEESSLNIMIYCFTKTTAWVEYMDARENLLLQIMDIIDELGIRIGYPSRSLYMEQETAPVVMKEN